MEESFIGIDKHVCSVIAGKLNVILSTLFVAYNQAWYNHWNVKGPLHDNLHVGVFGRHKDEIGEAIDLIAERITNLDGCPDPNPAVIARQSLRPYSAYLDARSMLEADMALEKDIAKAMRELFYESEKLGDPGTNTLLGDLVRQVEFRIQRIYHLLHKDFSMFR
jgi:bacterioferritin